MKLHLIILNIFIIIFPICCERKFLKIENCTVNTEIAKIDTCELKDGVLKVGFKLLEPLNEFYVRKTEKISAKFKKNLKKVLKLLNFLQNLQKRLIKFQKFYYSKNQMDVCFYKFEHSRPKLLNKCQVLNYCEFVKNPNKIGPNIFLNKLVSYLKVTSLTKGFKPCPLNETFGFYNLNIDNNFVTFLPRGILRITSKGFNKSHKMIYYFSGIIMNK